MLIGQFIKFIFVGILNTIFGYSIYALFVFYGLDYKIAAFLATVCGVAFNFKTTGVLVFKSHDNSLIFRFVGVYVIVYGFNVLGITILKMYGLNDYTAGAVCILPAALISFFLNKFFVFGGFKAERFK